MQVLTVGALIFHRSQENGRKTRKWPLETENAISNGKSRKITFQQGKTIKDIKFTKYRRLNEYISMQLFRGSAYIFITHISMSTEFPIFCMYNLYGKTEFPFFHHIETELKIFRNGKGNFLKRKISTPTYGCALYFRPQFYTSQVPHDITV